ncbi:MAG: acyl-CoA dehydrogenase family protein, partial [Actinomycetota bacterium]
MADTRYELFTEEHEALRSSVRDFVGREIRPFVEEWEAQRDFPRSLYERVGELGLFGLKYEEEYGGSGPDLLADAVVTEEFTLCGAGGVAAGLGAHKDLGSYYVYRFGNEDQRKKWLVPSIRGELISALAVTEPGAGSDVASITTKAVRD